MNQLSPLNLPTLEIELLLYCSRIRFDAQAINRVQAIVKHEIDWDYFIQIANIHQVIQIVYQNISQACPDSLPEDVLNRLKFAYHTNALNNRYLAQELIELQDLFEQHNISVIFFKGATLAVSAYGNIELRHYKDIDVLVEEYSFLKATDLLISHGYELSIQVTWEYHFNKNKLCSIDLHRYIVPQHLSCSLDKNYIWENVDHIVFSGHKIPVLAPEVELLILCLNGTKECWRNLNRICDISALIYAHPQLNWTEIMQHAHDKGFKRVIFIGILLAKNLLQTPIPPLVWQSVESDLLVNSLFEEVKTQLCSMEVKLAGEIERTLFHIRIRERWRDKIQSLIGILNHSGWIMPTEKDREFLPLPKFLRFLYYIIRPFRILKKYGLNTIKNLIFLNNR